MTARIWTRWLWALCLLVMAQGGAAQDAAENATPGDAPAVVPVQARVMPPPSPDPKAPQQGRLEAKKPPPVPPTRAFLRMDHLRWDPVLRRHLVSVLPPKDPVTLTPRMGPAPSDGMRNAIRLLRSLYRSGRASGLTGVIYDNRDSDHSAAPVGLLPGLIQTRYGKELHKRKLNYGMAEALLFDRTTIGNSSTAYTKGFTARSLPRDAMLRPGGAQAAYQTYASNHLYVYPEHRDHDGVDRFPANWPYTVISQGSSYSDKPFVRVLALILAALPPETFAALERGRLMAPTLQMLLRRSMTSGRSRAEYFTGRAHPTVFDHKNLHPDRAVTLAAGLSPDQIPPVVDLRVISESFVPKAGLAGMSERLFDTPNAIARVWRGPAWEKTMIVEARARGGPLTQQVTFDWRVLRGDPKRIDINVLNARGSRARVRIKWHERRRINPRQPRETDRIDIGVFARAEAYDSAPSLISVTLPTHQKRTYEPGPDGRPRLSRIDYAAPAPHGPDPLLFWRALWADQYLYTAEGQMSGWRRHYCDGGSAVFSAAGMTEGGDPRPEPRYRMVSSAQSAPRLRDLSRPEFDSEAQSGGCTN